MDGVGEICAAKTSGYLIMVVCFVIKHVITPALKCCTSIFIYNV